MQYDVHAAVARLPPNILQGNLLLQGRILRSYIQTTPMFSFGENLRPEKVQECMFPTFFR